MGNQQSSSNIINDTVNKSLSNILISSSSSCSQTNSLEQSQVFSNITGEEGCSVSITDVNQMSQQSPNFTCASSKTNDSELMAKFKTELEQQAEAHIKNSTIGNAESRVENSNKLVNDIVNNISISNISSCVQDNFLKQSQGVNNIKASCPSFCRQPEVCVQLAKINPAFATAFCDSSKCNINMSGFNQSAIQGAIANCLAEDTNYQKALGESANTLTQMAETTNDGVDVSKIVDSAGNAVSNIISSSQTVFIVIGVVIVILAALAAYFLLSGGSSKLPAMNYQQFRTRPSMFRYPLSANTQFSMGPQQPPGNILSGISQNINPSLIAQAAQFSNQYLKK